VWYHLKPMGTQPNQASKLAFGPFEYDELSGTLVKHGIRIRLQGKPLQILLLLVSQPGEVISREDLKYALWQSTTFGDFEQGLNSAVNKLRQILGDSADQPRYVETLPGRGYRFVAPVRPASIKAVLDMPAPALLRIEPNPRRQMPTWRIVLASVALAGVVFGGYWLTKHSAGTAETLQTLRFAVLPPSGFALEGAASRQSFALSPDGSRLAFTAMDASGAFSVFLRNFNSLQPQLLPGSEGAHTVFWSPDSQSLYFTANGKLWRTNLQDDARVLLSESPSFLFSGVWLDSERILADGFTASYLIPPSGGRLQRLKDVYWWPQRLPDGQHALYVRRDNQSGHYRARVLRLNDFSTISDLIETDSRVQYAASTVTQGKGYLLYVRAGNLLAHPFDPRSLQLSGEAIPVASGVYFFTATGAADFSVSDRGGLVYQSYKSRSQLMWVDRAGHPLASIGPPNINLKSARLSPDGRLLATAIYDIERGAQDLWIFDVKTYSGRRLSSYPALRDAPVWSPDSTMLAFMHQADDRPPRLHIRGLEEKGTEEVLPAADFQMPMDWSPDGRFVAFVNTGFPRFANETQGDVYVSDRARSQNPIPLLNTRFHESNPSFSPDGKWLAFTTDESGRPELYIQAFRGDSPSLVGPRYLVSNNGAQAVRWRRDGSELFYLDLAGRIQAISMKLSPHPKFGPSKMLFSINTEARASIHSVLGFDVSADGQRFVIPTVSPAEAPSLVIIQNWEALLPRKR
jgi:Tol biopolymer transport system component/DNA-binding winged helix-turn-helix (wHTH) protein